MRKLWGTGLLLLVVCFTAVTPGLAQAPAGEKPPVYLYSAEWVVPRAQWADMDKLADADKPVLDKLVADGTLVGYGAWSNLMHQAGAPTHGTWFSATSEGKLLKALEAIYAQPLLVGAPAQGASKHWDYFLTASVYGSKPGASGGYLTWSRWEFQPGQMRSYMELVKKTFVPMLDKLLAEGTITSYGELTEDYHTEKMGVVFEYFTVPDAASLDKANDAFEALFNANPTLMGAVRSMTSPEGHRDYITRLRFMNNK